MKAQGEGENSSKSDNENGDRDDDDDDYDDDEFPPVHIKLPLQLDLDDIAGVNIHDSTNFISLHKYLDDNCHIEILYAWSYVGTFYDFLVL